MADKQPAVVNDLIPVNSDKKSDLSNVVDILLNDDYSKRKTILAKKQIATLTTLDVLGQIYDIQFLKEWVQSYSEWRTSSEGQGRKDVVDITKFRLEQEDKRQQELLNAMGRR